MADLDLDPLKTLKSNLQRLRAEKRMTMGALERRAGLGHTTASQAMNGPTVPSEATVLALARALGTDPDPLLNLLARVSLGNIVASNSLNEPIRSDVWNVPQRIVDFHNRESELASLFVSRKRHAPTTVRAIRGRGGIGKTQLAIEYSYRHADRYKVRWWVNAESIPQNKDQMLKLAAALNISTEIAEVALLELRDRLNSLDNWLMIFDNADDANLMYPWIPNRSGHVIVTTRSPVSDELSDSVTLPEFSRTSAVEMITTRLPWMDSGSAAELAARLDFLPLALAQATAFIRSTGMPISIYLDLIESKDRRDSQ